MPPDFVAPTPGVLRPMTTLDDQILAGVKPELDALAEKLRAARDEPPAPIHDVTGAEWESLNRKPEPVTFARFGTDARGNATVPRAFRSEPGYVYRTVDEARVGSDWRVGEYAAGHPATIYAQSDRSVVLRTREADRFEQAASGVNAADNRRARGIIAASEVEVLGADGTWTPVLAPARAPTAPVLDRLSVRSRQRLDGIGADMTAAPDPAILARPENKVGVQVLSLINRGVIDTEPATLRGIVELERQIENGNATRMGIGADLLAEAQRVARDLLDRAAVTTKQALFDAGVMTAGRNPGMIPDETLPFARELLGKKGLINWNPGQPFVSMQYGLKARPADQVVAEWAQVPGLAEEFLSGNFKPWHERYWTAQLRQAYNFVFGPLANSQMAVETKARFIARLAGKGVDGETAGAIWSRWKGVAAKSHEPAIRTDPVTKVRQHLTGDNRFYGDVRNIPNGRMDAFAHEAFKEHLAPGVKAGTVTPDYLTHLSTIDYSTEFREASSFIRRHLADSKLPLGDVLATMYGTVAHNQWVTTYYYMYRFGLDPRFRAMNFAEAHILHAGRAGMKPEFREGLVGQTEAWMTNMSKEAFTDTGYAVMNNREAIAYKTFLKERREPVEDMFNGLLAEDPALMSQAMDEIIKMDPELGKTIALMGDTPAKYLKVMDAYWAKLMRTTSDEDVAKIIGGEIDKAISDTPALNELYSELRKVNTDVIRDMRDMFYGRASRSRAERVLNHYLLFWPLSYQIKSTKWLAKVLFDSAGGLPTNAAGAYALDGMMKLHNEQLAKDPAYGAWFEKHQTLVFLAQMLLPMTWDSMGTSLSPPLRSVFFGRSKAWWDVGPIRTAGLFVDAVGELYSDMRSVPGFDAFYRANTGMKPGQRQITVGKPEPTTPSPIDELLRDWQTPPIDRIDLKG